MPTVGDIVTVVRPRVFYDTWYGEYVKREPMCVGLYLGRRHGPWSKSGPEFVSILVINLSDIGSEELISDTGDVLTLSLNRIELEVVSKLHDCEG